MTSVSKQRNIFTQVPQGKSHSVTIMLLCKQSYFLFAAFIAIAEWTMKY